MGRVRLGRPSLGTLRGARGPAGAALALLLVLGAPASAPAAEPEFEQACARYGSTGVRVAECVQELQIARRATEKYHDRTVAVRDGFVSGDLGACDEHPGAGAMGQHWFRFDRMADEELDPRRPEILLYVDTPDGVRLVGAEWSSTALQDGAPHYGSEPPDPSHTSPAPTMFGGRAFDGPMQGHNWLKPWSYEWHLTPQPWHYDLHVWLWAENPGGIFSQYNARVSCDRGIAPEEPDEPGAGARPTRLRLTVSPRRVRAGRRARFRFRTAAGGTAVSGATVRFAGRTVRSGASGRATLVRRIGGPGRYTAVARKRGLGRATAAVRVVR